jgi:translation initiation factor 2 subunit 3
MASSSDGLAEQHLQSLDVMSLTPLTREVMSRQATINIAMLGHVAHGKSSVVRGLTGVDTVRFRHEKERNLSIKLGYANAKIYKCDDPTLDSPSCYASFGSATPDVFPRKAGGNWMLQRHISFVDCPGHDILTATMLSGLHIVDAAMLVVAGNEAFPQPQAAEHLAAAQIARLKQVLVLQNKVELVKEDRAKEQAARIRGYVAGSSLAMAPILPICAVSRFNLDLVCEYLCSLPLPSRDFVSSPVMSLIRSFDVNRPGADWTELKGGVVGGTLLQGVLRLGDEVEIRPGLVTKGKDGSWTASPIRTKILSLFSEENRLQYAVPGGLVGVGTGVDPAHSRGDRLAGHVLGIPGDLPDVLAELDLNFYLLNRILGAKTEQDSRVSSLKIGEILMLNIDSKAVGGRVLNLSGTDLASVSLTSPVCASLGSKVSISRRVDKQWRLVGWGRVLRGVPTEVQLAKLSDSMS